MTKRQAVHILIQVPCYCIMSLKQRLEAVKYYIKQLETI